MFDLLKKFFKPIKVKFINKNNEEVKYKEYIEKENMIIIETETGLEKIPVTGLRIKK